MASTWSDNLKIELLGTGDTNWGTLTNNNFKWAIEESITGYATATFPSDADYDWAATYTNSNSSQAQRNLVITVTGSISTTRNLVVPTIEKQYIVQNNTTGGQSITVKTSAGTGITVPNGRKAHLYVDGTNVIQMSDYDVTRTIGTLSLTNALAVTQGGTGATSATNARTNLGLVIGTDIPSPTGTGASGTWNISILGNAATATTATTATSATNIASGAAGSLPYQSGASATTFLAIGVANQVLTSTGSAPQWSTDLTIGGLTASGAVTFSATTQNISLGASQTSGTFVLGGTAATGAITLDQSTKTHTLNVGSGATENAATKTINIGTSGVSGSTTAITIGSLSGTSTTVLGATTLNSSDGVTVFVGNDTASNSGSGQITFRNKDGGGTFRNVARISGVTTDNGGNGDFLVETYSSASVYPGLKVDKSSNVSMYDTSSNVKLFWQASTSRLGVNTNTPATTLDVNGAITGTSINKVTITAPASGSTLTIADGKTLTVNNSLTLAGTDGRTMTFPSTNATIARTDAAQTFTGTQTFSSDIKVSSLTVGRGGGASLTNTAVGYGSLSANTTGYSNTAVGFASLNVNLGGNLNTAVGYNSLNANTTGVANTAVGYSALFAHESGIYNIAIGSAAGDELVDGSRNILIGRTTQASATDGSDQVVIGYDIVGKGDDTAFIGGTNGAYNQKNVTTWETTSDARLKKNIVDNNDGLQKILAIRVRNFEYRTPEEVTDLPVTSAIAKEGVQLGVIAQEMLPECVSETSVGVKSVNTDPLVWYLINAVKELAAQVEELKSRVS